ncbi:MAG TPA: TspO/MBR family protein [Candidatus Paceibacterota bacterium]
MNALKLILAVAICELAGIAGSFFTVSQIPTWYAGLVKPVINPPAWLFGPVWVTLYLLMGISLWLIWSSIQENL